MGSFSPLSVHPLLEARHMDQSRGAFAFARVDERVVCVHHLVHQTDSTRWNLLFLTEVHLSSMPSGTVVCHTCSLYKVHIKLLRRSSGIL